MRAIQYSRDVEIKSRSRGPTGYTRARGLSVFAPGKDHAGRRSARAKLAAISDACRMGEPDRRMAEPAGRHAVAAHSVQRPVRRIAGFPRADQPRRIAGGRSWLRPACDGDALFLRAVAEPPAAAGI